MKEHTEGKLLPTEMEEYLFDLNGFLKIENAIDPDHVTDLNKVTKS